MDPWMIIGLFWLAWIVAGRMAKDLQRHRKAKLERERGPQPICGCGDHYAFHDPHTGHCHATSREPSEWDMDGLAVAWKHVQCGCRQYVGPQPLETYYAPEITGDTAIRPRLDKGDDTPEEQ